MELPLGAREEKLGFVQSSSAPIDLARPRAREIAWWTHSSKNSRNISQNSWTTIACGSRLPCPRGGDAGFGRASKPRRSVGDLKSTTIRLVRRNDYRCESESGSRTLRVAYVTDEEPSSARPARRTSLFGNPTFGGPAGDQKSPLRRCFKPRPLVENECKPVASDRRSGCGVWIGSRLEPSRLSTPAAVRPLVRMPTDRHAATGTCELGKRTLTQSSTKIQDAN